MIALASIVVRDLADTFASHALRSDPNVTIDIKLAREQHEAYVAALHACTDCPIIRLPADPNYPDGVFVEDTAVVLDSRNVLLTRQGAPSRRGESLSLSFQRRLESIPVMTDPATLDGGDVLRIQDMLIVGLSTRTNQAGADFLAQRAQAHGLQVIVTRVADGLHLKSACSLADENLFLYDADAGIDLSVTNLKCVAAPEKLGANVLALGNRNVLVSAAAPKTAAMLRARGLTVTGIDMSEFHKADGALTCPSIRIPMDGAWCT